MSVNTIKDTTHRFANVTEEPCVMLTPIEGYQKMALVTLEEASVPLHNIVPRIATYVHVAKERAMKPADNLSSDESASIALYTMEWEPFDESVYYILNDTLRSEDRNKLKPWFLYLKLVLTALSRLPSISLTVYRGVKSQIESEGEKYETGRSIVWWGFSSCSVDRNISAKDQFLGETGRRTLFLVDCVNGKNICKHSYHKTENEVLLLPATKVQVIENINCGDGLHQIHLKEIQSSFILRELISTPDELRNRKDRLASKFKSFSSKESVIDSILHFIDTFPLVNLVQKSI